MFDKNHSEETKLIISQTKKGIGIGRRHSDETKQKMREKRKNQVFSPETKLKMSISAKLRCERIKKEK